MVGAPLLQLAGVEKIWPNGTVALRGVDLTLHAGRVHGLLGANGAGKSTLIKVLAGAIPASGGTVAWRGELVRWASPRAARAAGVATIYQHIPLVPTLSVVENMLLERAGGWRADRAGCARAAQVASLLDNPFDLDALVGDLPIGTRQMVAIAQGLMADPALLIMDEPTASLAGHERERVYAVVRLLAAQGHAVLFVSHFLDEILSLTDEVTVLRDGRAVLHAQTADLDEAAIAAAIVGRSVTALERRPRAARAFSNPPPEGEGDQPQAGGGVLSTSDEARGALPLHHRLWRRSPSPSGGGLIENPPALELRDLGSPGKLAPTSLTVAAGEIVGIAGMLGSGRSELLHAIFGADPAARGAVLLHGKPIGRTPEEAVAAGVALVPEDRATQGFVAGMSVAENIALPRTGLFQSPVQEHEAALAAIERLAIKVQGPDAPVGELSGGNAQKVVIAKWLTPDTRLLLLDEPTAGIDIGARTDILRLIRGLADEGLPVLLVSSEFEELIGVCDRILVMRDGLVIAEVDPETTDEAALIQRASGNFPSTGMAA
ncbi:sugar ABC transporter ATP-binding protein [Sphingomonas kyeonggiensis]|uniref:Ribose transport system ATP-binding protein n=1 Tax=Sphingomonas kyeonggiensis TaxID=1268553 RepID=A0A7W6JV54_9SPHN|nr:sugar ABC transporter ATP-binding protein [Sphingomonas kyeonggiensis]MBB4099076.1 ribose transport system ATP-binding protein [Sphingomonas kyeonggiensis]